MNLPYLTFQKYGSDHPLAHQIWILHGILGTKQNWGNFARTLSSHYPEYAIYTIDLRCHGQNEHFVGPHTKQRNQRYCL